MPKQELFFVCFIPSNLFNINKSKQIVSWKVNENHLKMITKSKKKKKNDTKLNETKIWIDLKFGAKEILNV